MNNPFHRQMEPRKITWFNQLWFINARSYGQSRGHVPRLGVAVQKHVFPARIFPWSIDRVSWISIYVRKL